MTTNYDGGPAFARSATERNMGDAGMSLRDWFAGQALAGLVIDSLIREEADAVARTAFRIADAMIAARDAK